MRTLSKSVPVRIAAGAVTVALALTGPLATGAFAVDHADSVATFTRDVFVAVGPTLRNPDPSTTAPTATLFNVAAVRLEQSPNKPITWGQWSSATATSKATTMGAAGSRQTDFRLDFTGLVPNGNYSIFYGTLLPDSSQPLCPAVERTLPLDAVKPDRLARDPNSFVAGGKGNASYHGRVAGNLFHAQTVFLTVVFHAFAEPSAYPFPNVGEFQTQGPDCRSSFGEDSMRQLVIFQKGTG